MKQLILLVGLLFLTTEAFSQIERPPLSQKQRVEQKVGFTEVIIEYCRPEMRGRKIFGGLQKYGEVWRTGANRNTQITFNESIRVGDTQLLAGTYTLFSQPNLKEWKIYFYPFNDEYGVPADFSEDKAEAIITVPVFELNRPIQSFTINLENVTQNTADLSLMWERTYIAIPIKFTTGDKILNDISDIVNSHSSDYYMAAKYYLDTGNDLESAKVFIQKAIDMREEPGGTPMFWVYQMQAEIFLANNEKEAALKSGTKAMEMAKPRGSDDIYVKQIKDLLKKLK